MNQHSPAATYPCQHLPRPASRAQPTVTLPPTPLPLPLLPPPHLCVPVLPKPHTLAAQNLPQAPLPHHSPSLTCCDPIFCVCLWCPSHTLLPPEACPRPPPKHSNYVLPISSLNVKDQPSHPPAPGPLKLTRSSVRDLLPYTGVCHANTRTEPP